MTNPFRWPGPAWQFVVAACAPTPHTVDALELDWSHVTTIALQQRVYPRVFAYTAQSLPPGPRATLQARAADNARAALANLARTIEVTAVLTAAGVESIILKGPLLARHLYGDAAARVAGDVDVLVAEAKLMRASRALADAGYRHPTPITPEALRHLRRSEHDVAFAHPEDRILVELHADIAQPHYGYRADLASWWAARQAVRIGHATVFVLSPEHAYLHSALHAAKHRWHRLDVVMDLAAFADSGIDDGPIREEAARAGLLRAVETGQAMAATVFRGEPPRSSQVRQAISQLVAARDLGRWRGMKFDLRMRESWQDRADYLWKRLITRRLS